MPVKIQGHLHIIMYRFDLHRLADINIRNTLNSCTTVKEIINELERTLAAKLRFVANSSFRVLLIALTVDAVERESSVVAFGFLLRLWLLIHSSIPRSRNTLISYNPQGA